MNPRENVVCRTGLAQARGSFGRIDARRLCRRRRLDASKVSGTHRTHYIKDLPSMPWNRLLGGVYTSLQFGQNSFTVSIPGMSDRPQGTTFVPLHITRGQEPNVPASYFSTYICI